MTPAEIERFMDLESRLHRLEIRAGIYENVKAGNFEVFASPGPQAGWRCAPGGEWTFTDSSAVPDPAMEERVAKEKVKLKFREFT